MKSKDEKLYVLPCESVEKINKELLELKNMSSFFLKHYVDLNELESWDHTPILHLCELYGGSVSLASFIEELRVVSTTIVPEQYRESISEGDIVVTNSDYVAFSTLVEGLRSIKDSTSTMYGISFEVH